MENHRVGTLNDKMCTDSSTGKNQNLFWPNQPIIWDILEKSHHMSIVHARLLKPIHSSDGHPLPKVPMSNPFDCVNFEIIYF